MDNKVILSTLLFLIGYSLYGQMNENGNLFNANFIEHREISTPNENQLLEFELEFDSIRILSELNLVSDADAYPWISNDGLRLYYTQDSDDNLYPTIVFSEREHIDGLFSDPVTLSINSLSRHNFSSWLTKDELNIYFFRRSPTSSESTFYHASRDDITEEFGEPAIVELLDGATVAIPGFKAGPSFTLDFEQLFVYQTHNDSKNILILEKVTPNQYIVVDSLNIPAAYSITPGQLASNDLKYFLGADNLNNGDKSVYVIERQSVDEDFGGFSILENEQINDPSFRNHHPSISDNENYFVFVRATGNMWGLNDLYIAYNKLTVDADNDGFISTEDCNDLDASINPDATEIPYNGIDEDCNELTLDDDLDQDGFNFDEDCDDSDATINPDATEIPYNGIDEDCNELTLDDDLDQDGFNFDEDCDDLDATINPAATEIENNGIDEDCDGSDLIVNSTSESAKLVLKIYPNPVTKGLIFIENKDQKDLHIKIYEPTGQVMLHTTKEVLDVSTFSNGIYIMALTDKKSNLSFFYKIIINQ